ncbi:sorting nexin-14-like isoform 3-T3 [Synchiropus picturatus]
MAGPRGSMRAARELGRQYPLFCFLLLSLAGVTLLLHSYLHVLMLFWSFVAGVVTFYCSIGPDTLVPNLMFAGRARLRTKGAPELSPLGCAVCGKVRCGRHRSTLRLENHQPWLDLKVPSQLDGSIAEVFELVLENFVYPWYRDITDDEACVDQLRETFRFFASVLLRRAQKVDLLTVVTEKVMKVAMKHLEVLARSRDRVRSPEQLQQAALDQYGAQLHVALRSRRQELRYLRALVQTLFPLVMPPDYSQCRSLALLLREVMAGSVFLPTMDFLADPDTVNLMVLLFVDDTPPDPAPGPPSPPVSFLHRYAHLSSNRSSVLQVELKEIRQQQDLLFRFMNFLKQEGAVQVLQFCLALEEFNDQILRPELQDWELQRLHRELRHIYATYCLEQSPDKIQLDPDVVEDIRLVCAGPPASVLKLQTSTSLFQAHEHICSLLEQVFTPMFCHSDEYFRHLLRGSESAGRNCRVSRNASRRGESSGISRIGSRIKGVFRSGALEGALLPAGEPDDDTVEEAAVVLEDDVHAAEPAAPPAAPRNLAAWIVNIPYVEVCEDKTPVFCVYVERNDHTQGGQESESWPVYRRYLEFYVLESKLTEFHGVFPDAQLPSKRILGPKNLEFLASKREEFEEYLQKLLQHPELSSSQLLADFLSPHSLGSQFLERILPDVNLGKIFKSVPGRLVKERGQNLEPFIQNFFSSCDSPKPKPSRPELVVLSPSVHYDKKVSGSGTDGPRDSVQEQGQRRAAGVLTPHTHTHTFFQLLHQLFRSDRAPPTDPAARQEAEPQLSLSGLYDYMMFAGRVVFGVPDWLHHFLCAGRILFKRTLEGYLEQRMQSKLEQVLQEHRLLSLITQFRDAVFCEAPSERTPEDRRARAQRTLQEMRRFLPDLLSRLVGEDSVQRGVRLVFEGLQQPLLNKQMSYVLLDIAVQELFPELSPPSDLSDPRDPSEPGARRM